MIAESWKILLRKLAPALVATVAFGTLGGFALHRALAGECCSAGASCCVPGAGCCNHRGAQAQR